MPEFFYAELVWLPLTGAGAVLFLLFILFWLRRRRLSRFYGKWFTAPHHLLPNRGREILLISLLAAVISALGLLALDPQKTEKVTIDKKEGVRLVFVLDVSPSMLAEDTPFKEIDFDPVRYTTLCNRKDKEPLYISRLCLAKISIVKLLDEMRSKKSGDRIALVVFADEPYAILPIFTGDYDLIFRKLEDIDDWFVWKGVKAGSNFGKGIYEGLSLFDFKDKKEKVMIMLTDGEREKQKLSEVESFYRQAVLYYREKGNVAIYVAGLGDPAEKSLIPIYDDEGNPTGQFDVFKKGSEKGRFVKTSPDPEFLQKMAHRDLGGEFLMPRSGSELKEELASLIDRKRKIITQEKKIKTTSLRDHFLYGSTILLLLLLFFV